MVILNCRINKKVMPVESILVDTIYLCMNMSGNEETIKKLKARGIRWWSPTITTKNIIISLLIEAGSYLKFISEFPQWLNPLDREGEIFSMLAGRGINKMWNEGSLIQLGEFAYFQGWFLKDNKVGNGNFVGLYFIQINIHPISSYRGKLLAIFILQ